ncbi:hypothetical protein OJF2_43350 [Aquisphaera giovannonii]|uniref:Uncharacterized protein n=1 Tax=Aquisphaera giovannonii TaxID=406548 RepID=A0A5B9W5C1_9BACT|nr:hypothetical protein [Aquisphaera giovannonii]QEH35778.1 hypothetical protein OJF2_43350 [Aquisphaera giovannonii]
MELTFSCPRCQAVGHVPGVERAGVGPCKACGAERALHGEAFEEGRLAACPWCGTADLYIQKDFPQALGLAIVLVGFAISTVFWYLERPIVTYLILLASALLDMILYYRVPDVTICYRCLAQVRGEGSNPGGRFRPFDLAVGERYRQERLRVDELRRRDAPSLPGASGVPDEAIPRT